MKNRNYLFLALILLVSNLGLAQNPHYSYSKPKPKDDVDIDHISKFEFGIHYGPAWTTGETRDFAQSGSSFGVNLGSNNGRVYFGTELNITSWNDYQDTREARDLNFNETNMLWLVESKLFMGEGKVQPFIGCGTDLISFGKMLITDEEDDYEDYYYEEEERNYNAWFVPSFGVRWKMGKDVSGNVGLSADLSDNYSYMRLQLGLVF